MPKKNAGLNKMYRMLIGLLLFVVRCICPKNHYWKSELANPISSLSATLTVWSGAWSLPRRQILQEFYHKASQRQ